MAKKVLIAVVIAALLAYAGYRYMGQDKRLAVKVIQVDRGDVVASVTNTRAGTVDTCRRAGSGPGQRWSHREALCC